LKEIAQEFSLEWDSSNTEAELGKKHEDLLVAVNLVLLVAHILKPPFSMLH
jgi:vacuolar protein sorting-associated protein IST1